MIREKCGCLGGREGVGGCVKWAICKLRRAWTHRKGKRWERKRMGGKVMCWGSGGNLMEMGEGLCVKGGERG